MDSNSIANQIAEYDKNAKGSVDVLNDAMKQYGIPEIRNRVAGLRTTLTNTENALNNVDPSVSGRTQGSLVTEAQRERMVQNEKAPIMQNYSKISGNLSNESGNLSDQMQAAQLLASSKINDYNTGRQALQSRYQDAVSREAEQRRQMEADRAYQLQVEAQKQAASSAGAGGGYDISGGNKTGQVASVPKNGKDGTGGFGFIDGNGKAISAATYAAARGLSLKTILLQMSAAGDAGATKALSFINSGGDPNDKALRAFNWTGVY